MKILTLLYSSFQIFFKFFLDNLWIYRVPFCNSMIHNDTNISILEEVKGSHLAFHNYLKFEWL